MTENPPSVGIEIFVFVAGSSIVAAIVGVVAYVKRKIGCQDKIDARTLRQSHAMIAMAKNNDEETARLHPNEPKPNSASVIESLLKDEYGNL